VQAQRQNAKKESLKKNYQDKEGRVAYENELDLAGNRKRGRRKDIENGEERRADVENRGEGRKKGEELPTLNGGFTRRAKEVKAQRRGEGEWEGKRSSPLRNRNRGKGS